MALFPAYSSAANSSEYLDRSQNAIIFPSCLEGPSTSSLQPSAEKDNWLSNRSFAASRSASNAENSISWEKSNDPASLSDNEDDEVKILEPKNRDPEISSRHREKRRRRSRSKSRKRDRSERKKKRHHERRRSKSPKKLTPDVQKIAKLSQEEKWDFSSSKSYSAEKYTTDRRRELENLQFNSVYKRQVAKFGYAKARLNLLSGRYFLHTELFGVNKMKSKERYFTVKRRRKLAKSSIGNSKVIRVPNFPLEDVIEIGSASMIDENGEELYYDPTIQMYRKAEQKPAAEDLTYERTDQEKEKLRLQQAIHENPQDIQSWLEFITLEDRYSVQKQSKVSDLAILERKMAIIDKAIAANQSSTELKILRIKIGKEGLWERDRMKQEWARLEFNHVNQPSIWREQINFFLGNFTSFKVGKVLALFDRAIEKFQSVVLGKLLTHKAPPNAEEFLLELLVWKANFLAQSGFREKALATFQAAVEFNFSQPANVRNHGSVEKRVFFEPFWDSGLPRIGDEGATGWSSAKQSSVLSPSAAEEEFNEAENSLCLQNLNEPDGRLWKRLEELREKFHWKPWRSTDEPEDPDRVVLFDDIKSALVEFREEKTRFQLLLSFLSFLGVHLLPYSDGRDAWRFEPRFEKEIFGTFQSLPQFSAPSPTGIAEMIDGIFETIERDYLPMEPYRTYIACTRLHHSAVTLRERKDCSEKERLKSFKKSAKQIFQNERNRNCLILYAVYAEELSNFTHASAFADATSISKTALSMAATLLSSDSNEDEDSSPIAVLKLVHIVVKAMSTDLQEITRYLAGFFTTGATVDSTQTSQRGWISSTEILKAKKFAEEKLNSFKESYSPDDEFSSMSYCGSALTHLTTLAAWFYYASSNGSVEGMKTGEKLFRDSALRIMKEKENSSSGNESTCIGRDLELLLEARVEFVRTYVNSSPLASISSLRHTLEDAVAHAPGEAKFWNELVRLSSQGFRLVQFRRFLSDQRGESKNLSLELAAIRAEFDRYSWLIESQETGERPQVHSLRKSLESAVDRLPHQPILWRLYLKFESLAQTGAERCKQIFFRAIRSCPWSKELFKDFVEIAPDEAEIVVDLLIEKELRVRIPMEELEVLKEAAAQGTDD